MPAKKDIYTPEFPIPFSEAWPLSATEAYLEMDYVCPDHKDSKAFEKWRTELYQPMNARLERAIVQHLTHLATTVGLAVPEHTEGLDVCWITCWTSLAKTGATSSPYDVELLTRPFGMDLMMAMDGLRCPPENTDRAQFVHDQLLEWIEKGPRRDVELSDCRNSGTRIYASLKNWAPVLGTKSADTKYKLTPLTAGQFSDPTIAHFTIHAPSGELWINDWFRVKAFTNLCQEITKGLPSINSEAGALEQTRAYAEQLGFASFAVGNSGPSVVLHDNTLFIGRTIEQGDDWGEDGETQPIAPLGKTLGSVCTDLWWTTIIDKEVLIDLVARAMPRSEAIAEVDKMAKEYGHTIMKAQVPPGTYHLYCAGDTHTFRKKCASPDIDWTPWEEPFGVLSSKELTFDALSGPSEAPTKPKGRKKKV